MGTENYREQNRPPGHFRDSGPQGESVSDGDQVRRFDHLFDFLHGGLDRVQNISEAATILLFWLAQLWACQFIAGIVLGLLCVFTFGWLLIRVF